MPGVKQIKPGTSCTISGWPGTWQWVDGTMTCIPNNRSADSLNCYDLYDLQIADAWRGNKEASIGPNLQKEQEEEDDETDDDEDEEEEGDGVFERSLQVGRRGGVPQNFDPHREHHTSRCSRSFAARTRSAHAATCAATRRDRAFMDQVATQQKAREKIMDAEYGKYEAALQEAWRK